MKEIAIYGKGGIGKSTLSANISAALSHKNKRVLQIGCDPKHDSTRLLMGGRRITTVLDYIKTTGPLQYRLEDVLFAGYNGIGCIEAGGPKPGVGCAGRGIITAFELLEKFSTKDNYDIVIYDVLGDVVCGGFAVPIRQEYADTIFLVTSGEYMSIYAANNILKGIKNYDGDKCRVAGILYNSRNVKDEDVRVERFANAVGLPIFARIPRDDVFALAERENHTVVEISEKTDGRVAGIFSQIADKIVAVPPLYPADPLTDEALEQLIFYGTAARPTESASAAEVPAEVPQTQSTAAYDAGYLSKSVIRDEPLHGCAFNGAMAMSIHLRDAVLLAHSPKSCAYLSYQTISSTGRRRLFERGTLLSSAMYPNMVSTEMDESDMVFGGTDKLLDAVRRQIAKKPKAVVVVSSCPAGIIGDDIDKVKALSTPEIPVVPIKAEGNLTGDYLQGMLMAYTQLAKELIDPAVRPQPDVVNIVFEKVIARNTESNFEMIREWLEQMGVRVNCRFLCNTTCDALKNFCSASLNLLAYQDYTGKILRDFFAREYGCRFYQEQFPVGFAETERWLRGVADFFGRGEVAERIIADNRELYRQRIADVRGALAGKKVMIVTYNHDVDWILRAALDAGMEVVKLGILNFSQDENFRSALPEIEDIPVEEDYQREKQREDILKYQPDILLLNYETAITYFDCIVDTIPMCPDNGFFSGLLMVERWARLFHSDLKGAWKGDRVLFEKYYTR